eukprot:TRINITY_DN155_c0_g3_i1.p1 TRINITY_DN155_c0_g3~~TRINITY_DN155_c0_g3_i1.p1  ORF type:complete len:755 (+),score=217.06 TRINITY_DN155_c0_g3_i1:173-2437(+)
MTMRSIAKSCIIASIVASSQLFCTSTAYQVVRNVRDYGAKGDGVTDDTAAFIRALTEDRADVSSDVYPNAKYSPSTQHPAHVVVPSGTYVVTQTLPIVYYTQLVGDAFDMPTIKFIDSSNSDQRVLDSMGAWFSDVSQNNFYRQIRNLIIDMTECEQCTGVHWQVSQATSITNCVFKAKVGSKSQGMFMENGSGGFFSDLVFEGGMFGMWLGNQQFTIRNVTVRDTSVAAVYLAWNWIWTLKGLHVSNSPIGVSFGAQDGDKVGSLSIIDSDFTNIGTAAIQTAFDKKLNTSAGSLLLDNVKFDVAIGTPLVLNANGDKPLVAAGEVTVVKSWGQGHVWSNGKSINEEIDMSSLVQRNANMNAEGTDMYFERSRPVYADSDIVDVSTLGVVGDGVTDATDALQAALNQYANLKALLLPYGTYVISKTVYLPAGTRLFGQAWSLILAKGAAFQNAAQPTPVFKVGNFGESGSAELADLMFSTYGPQPGAVLVEWNMRDPADKQGACGIWDVHFRIGGAVGTEIRYNNCAKGDGTSAPAAQCSGAWALMHLTSKSSLYMQNVWGWVADHDIDESSQINVYNARGFLSESQGPVWMYGTAMEHSVLYQYNFVDASNVAMFTIQTETPYFQPSKNTPFDELRTSSTDPSFCTDDFQCNMAYGLHIANSSNIALYGTGMYSFFNVWDQSCLSASSGPNCQKEITKVTGSNANLQLFNLNTYGAVNMVENTGEYGSAASNSNWFCATRLFDTQLGEVAVM